MMGGYLERVAESGMTSLRDVRGSLHAAIVHHGREGQVAAPLARDDPDDRDETVSEPTRALPVPPSDARPDPRNPAVSRLPDMTVQPDATSHDTPATHVQPLAHPLLDAASPTRPPETRIEERWSHETVPARRSDARGAGAHAPSLTDAGIRSVRGVLSRDEMPAANGANRQRPVSFDVTVQPLDRVADDDGVDHQRAMSRPPGHSSAGDGERPSRHAGVSATRVDQWRRLKDRLLIEHYPGTSHSNVPFEGAEHNASQATNMHSRGREIVIEQLEVVVAAPQPASPPPAPGPRSLAPRSGAWSVATRRYLGKL